MLSKILRKFLVRDNVLAKNPYHALCEYEEEEDTSDWEDVPIAQLAGKFIRC